MQNPGARRFRSQTLANSIHLGSFDSLQMPKAGGRRCVWLIDADRGESAMPIFVGDSPIARLCRRASRC
jgi:hypothetical protein